MRLGFVVATAALAFAVQPASADVLYSNSLSSSANGLTLTGSAALETLNGITILGGLTQGATATLSAFTLLNHSQATLEFTLYTVRSLDGDNCCGVGPDSFKVTEGANTLLDNTFTNYGYWTQNYPTAGSAGGTGSVASGQLGTDFYGPDHTYTIALTFAHSTSSFSIVFQGNSDQGWADEGFGIANVKLSINNPPTSATAPGVDVPEPASLALLGAGLLGLAGLRRGRN